MFEGNGHSNTIVNIESGKENIPQRDCQDIVYKFKNE